jgi:pimeloyl-ACP methyl ester carboxylesterase
MGAARRCDWSDDELDAYAGVLREPRRANASSACYHSFITRELPASLLDGCGPDELDVPALLVMGENSPIRRVLNPQPSPNLRVEEISGAGHFLPEEAPERVLQLTLEHLAGA